MSEKEYDSVQYLSQEIQNALKRFIKKKTSGEINIKCSYNPNDNLCSIAYNLAGMRTRLTISESSNGYHLLREIGKKDSELEKTFEGILKIKRSKKGRISKDCADIVIKESMKDLRQFFKR